MEARNADLSALRIDRSSQEPPQSFSVRNLVVGLVVVAAIVAAGMYGYGRLVSPTPEVKLVTAALTSPAQSNAVLTASGYVVAQRKANVASKGTGRLAYLGVVEGDRVKKDQIIARLEDNDIRAQLDQAKANLRLNEADLVDAKQTLERTRTMFDKALASQAELDAATARYDRVKAAIEVARAAVAGAEVAVENMLIRAPFDGTVLTKNADVGEIVAPLAASASSRAAVVTLADMSSLQVEADVSESNIERIAVDQPCEITLDAYADKRYRAYVSKIVPTADRAKATVMVKVGFESYDSRVLPEMSAKVLFLTKANDPAQQDVKPFLAVPTSALTERDGRTVVFRVRDGIAEEIAVGTGRSVGPYTEITSGLTQGDKVVDKVEPTLSSGVKVKIQ